VATPLKRWVLPAVVFLTGASVLIVEVLAVRVLSPFYGNTIFTVSSVISVILLALSVGYYAGGVLADRRPSLEWFFGIILSSGILLLLLHFLGTLLLPALGRALSLEVGPLVSAALLFLLPALLLGTLSPYAVKLQSMYAPGEGVGRVAGEIFFWSTLGSITGSLLAGFVLIPRFGVDRILIANGVVLFALGFVPMLMIARRSKGVYAAPVVLALALGVPALAASKTGEDVVYLKDGVYQKITIYEGEYYGRPARFLLLDRSESGAMFLDNDDPAELVYDYTKYYSLYRVFTPNVRRALVLGGGAYSIPKALLRELPDAVVDVAEIEPSFFELSQQYFRVEPSPRLRNHVEDGRRFLQDAGTPYDLIFGDVYYSYFSVPPHFTTQEFFRLAKDRLAPGGVFIANMIGDLSRQQPSLILSEIKTFRTVFPNSYFYAVEAREKTKLVQNITLVGYNSDRRVDVAAPPVTTDPDPLIRFLDYRTLDVDRRYELSPYPILTDNFSPIEYVTAQVLRRSLGEAPGIDGGEIRALFEQQQRYGSRARGAPGLQRVRELVMAEMGTIAQELVPGPVAEASTNITAKLFASEERRVVLATPNDSASGVATLVELARALIDSPIVPKVGIDMVFFDDAARVKEGYAAAAPVSTLVLDRICDPGFTVAGAATALESDRFARSTGDPRETCSASALAASAEAVLSHLNLIR
jgi:spermidine synthase